MKQLDLRVDLSRDVAIVYLDSQIDDSLIINCIAAIDELVDKYDYRRVELRIVSPGGAASSMDYFLEEIGKWERKTTFVTRALTNAASAAAIILSLGNERRAEKRSKLLYHNTRIPINKDSQLTAREAETLAKGMHPKNEVMVERLATRACEISRDDWKKYLEKYLEEYQEAESSSPESHFNEHAFCAKLFNLPVERLVCCLLRHDDLDPDFRHWFALPAMSGSTGTVGGAGSAQVFKPDEFWKYIRRSFAPETPEHDDVGALNTIVENVLGSMRANGKEDHGKAVKKLEKFIREYLEPEYGAVVEEFTEQPRSYEEAEQFGIYHHTVETLYADTDVKVALSPEWKIESLMAALLDMDISEGSANDGFLKGRLCSLYRNLFELDQPIFPRVAKALGLIDGIGDEEAFRRKRDKDGPETDEQQGERTFREQIAKDRKALPVYEWRSLYPNGVSWPNLCRHTLILGETGSGKSKSGILPLIKAAVEAANEATKKGAKQPIGCMLVIDPKKEIGDYLDAWVQQHPDSNVNIHKLHEKAKKGHRRICLDLMAYETQSKDITESHYIDRAKAIFRMVASLIPKHAAGVLLGRSRGGNNDFWDQQGVQLSTVFVAIVMMLNDFRGKYGQPGVVKLLGSRSDDLWLYGKDPLMELVKEAARGGTNILHSAKRLVGIFGNYNNIKHLATLVSLISRDIREEGRQACPQEEGKQTYPLTEATVHGIRKELDLVLTSLTDERYAGSLMAGVNNCFFLIADDEAASSLFFGVEPGWEDSIKLDFREAVKIDKGNLDIFVYSPGLSKRSELISRSLKASYFAAVLNDPDRERGLDREPGNSDHVKSYVGYIADEFHRFITDDMRHGEQSFLDTCRSYGGFCTLACQSVESMRHALLGFGGSRDIVNSSIGILLNNSKRCADPTFLSVSH